MAQSIDAQIDEMTVAMLKAELNKRGLDCTGNKATLKERLIEAVEANRRKKTKAVNVNVSAYGSGNDDTVLHNPTFSHSTPRQNEGGGACAIVENRQHRNDQQQQFSFRDVEESLERFSGDDARDVKKWIREFEETSEMCGWNNLQMIMFARRLLSGSAKLFISSEGVIREWDYFKELLLGEFGVVVNSKIVHEQLSNRLKQTSESFRQYVYAMVDIASQADVQGEALVGYIIDGIQDTPANKSILYEAETLDELKEQLRKYERMKLSVQNFRSNHKTVSDTLSVNKAVKNDVVGVHPIKKCFKCGQTGHERRNCPDVKCYNCQEVGHRSNNCPRKNSNSVGKINLARFSKLTKEVKIGGKSVIAMVDSGASVSLMRRKTYSSLGLDSELVKVFGHVEGIGSSKVAVIGECRLNIDIDGDQYPETVLVVGDDTINTDMIIGLTVTDQAVLTIDSANNTVIFNKHMSVSENDSESTSVASEVLQIMNIDTVENHIEDIPINFRPQIINLIKSYEPVERVETPIETKIILSSEDPIFQRPRRLAPKEKEVVRDQIQEWLRDGIIRESFSEYASPVVVVRKKNGSYRVCIDYRRLNRNIIKDHFPMPIIEDQIDKLSSARVFTVLDLKNGFFHVPVNKESIKYTSFVTCDGQFEFLKTPFGLSVSPSSFLRYVQYVFKDLVQRSVVITYMDDIIIPAIDEVEAFEKLAEVLKVASLSGLQINWDKCRYLQRSVEFLGYVVAAGEILPSPNNISAINKFPEPKSVEEIQRFLGMCGYFRKFVEGFALLAKPLTELTKKDHVFEMGIKEKVSFENLKKVLCSDPVLKIFDSHAETELHTDASQEGYGAVLLQKCVEDGQWHPVYFLSKQTNPSEKKYHSYELEMLAIVYAFQKLRVYLLGLSVLVVTDCVAIKSTVEKTNVVPRIARWVMQLEEFDYQVQHRAGSRMKHVDALSRVVMQVDNQTISIFRDCQNRDDKIVAIMKILETTDYEDYTVQSDVLMRMVNGKNVLVVPCEMQMDIIRKVHENGHFSSKKVSEIIEQDYFIPKLRAKIETIVNNCVPCILAERKRGKREGFLRPIPKEDSPLQTYHIDFLGPLELTTKKYKHLFVVVDAFSKFVWLYATKSTTAAEVITCLEKQQQTFGNPKRIISDRGSAFTSNLFVEYCADEDIEHVLVTTGVPRGNGQVERVNQIIIPLLTKVSGDKPEKWYLHVRKIQQCLNSTYQRSVANSPFKLMLGVNMRQKEDLKLLSIIEEEMENVFIAEREELRANAKRNIERCQGQQRQYYNRKCKSSKQYQVGNLVAIDRTQFGPGLKLKGKFLGPYSVVARIGNDRYQVRKVGAGEGPKDTTSSADHMKPWRTGSSEADEEQDGRVAA